MSPWLGKGSIHSGWHDNADEEAKLESWSNVKILLFNMCSNFQPERNTDSYERHQPFFHFVQSLCSHQILTLIINFIGAIQVISNRLTDTLYLLSLDYYILNQFECFSLLLPLWYQIPIRYIEILYPILDIWAIWLGKDQEIMSVQYRQWTDASSLYLPSSVVSLIYS